MASNIMESPLVPFILYKIGLMRRHYQASDEHDGAQNRGHDHHHHHHHQQQQRRPQEPDDSRVRQADPPAVASPTSFAPTMHAAKKRRTSDTSSVRSFAYQKSKSFEERDEERSAFTSLPKTKDEEKTTTALTEEEVEQKPRQDPEEAGAPIVSRPVAMMSSTFSSTAPASSSHAQPHLSPMRYYHQQRYAEKCGSKPEAPAFHYQYREGAAFPTQHNLYGYPAGYYNPPQYPRPDPPSARGHPQFPYFQGYNFQPPPQHHHHQNTPYPDQMFPAYALPHSQPFDEYWTTPAGLSHSKKDPPEFFRVAQELKAGGEGTVDRSLNVSSPPMEEDERKPSARSSSGIQESSSRDHLTKLTSPTHDELHDLYAPIPFSEVGSMLTLPMKTPSPPSPSNLDPLSTSPERADERGARLPQHSPVVSSSKKRRQSHSTSATASVASVSKHGSSWDRRFSELLEFKELHGHCDVPQNYEPNSSLGIWVNKQRMEHKNRVDGKSSSLNDDRMERLQSVGFRWAKRKGQASWEEKFKELKEYKAEYGNCHVPTKYKENSALGRWVSTQRSEYKKFCEGDTKTSMTVDKIRRLEAIGFAWFMAL